MYAIYFYIVIYGGNSIVQNCHFWSEYIQYVLALLIIRKALNIYFVYLTFYIRGMNTTSALKCRQMTSEWSLRLSQSLHDLHIWDFLTWCGLAVNRMVAFVSATLYRKWHHIFIHWNAKFRIANITNHARILRVRFFQCLTWIIAI